MNEDCNKKFYIYQWVNQDNNEIFYIGKGCGKRAKERNKRNAIFKDYIKTHTNCIYQIIEYYDNENDAYAREEELIRSLHPVCNIAYGGYGGFSIIWTQEMREWKSKYNPMKDENRKQYMSVNNPMKNKNIAKLCGLKKRKIPIINNIEFKDCEEASIYFNVHIGTIQRWCKRGYDTNGNSCYYKNEIPKDYIFKKTNSLKVYVDDILFNSVKEASEYIGVWSETLIRAIKNNRKCKGHECRYANQQPSQENVVENSILEGSETNS